MDRQAIVHGVFCVQRIKRRRHAGGGMNTSSQNRRKYSRSPLILTAVALTPLTWQHASATTYQWVGGTSDWNQAANWTPSGGPPEDGDTADITSSLGLTQTITYDLT